MLKINKTRQTLAEFFAVEDGAEKLVKTTTINTNNNAVSTAYETLHNPELYAKHRATLRVDENALRELQYKIEDDVLAELTAEASDKVNV